MSAGVSDQRMKGQGNQVINSTSKNVEKDDRFIPWSQQVDDAPYEPVPSPTEGSQTGCYESTSSGGGTQFQYPPFKVKDGASWTGASGNNSKSSRRLSGSNDNYDSDGTYGSSHNNFQKNGDYYNSWSSQSQQQQSQQMNNASQNKKSNNYDEYYRADRGNYQNDVRVMQRGMQNMSLDGKNDDRSSGAANASAGRDKSTGQTSSAPKQMTWASIASQPAKQPLRSNRFASSSSSTLKKKGPGMPPPPMVPGKHNMDIGTWDSPKNGPQLVPPPPPPVIPVPIMEPPSNQNKNSSNLSNNRPSPQVSSGGGNSGGSGNVTANNAPQNRQGFNNQPNRNYNQNNSSNASNNNNSMRPSWAERDMSHAKNTQSAQNQRPSIHEGQSNQTSRQSSREDYSIHHQQPPQSVSPQPAAQMNYPPQAASPALSNSSSNYAILEELRDKNNYNPSELDLDTSTNARFFVIKSYSEDDIHRSIKYGIWCSTEHGNKRLDQAFRERESENGVVLLFFSVNGSGHFCGMARMLTPVDYNSVSSVWSQAKWKGTFKVGWIYVKDVPNGQLRNIRLENNENKSVTNSRDTQEVPNAKGIQVLRVLHSYKHVTSIFDDFFHYEKRQEEEDSKKYEPPPLRSTNHYEGQPNMSPPSKSQRGGSGDYDRGYEKGYSGGNSHRDKNYSRGGGFHGGYDNRRQYDDHRGGGGGGGTGGGFDRERDRYSRDGPGSGHYNNARGDNRDRENSGGDYNSRGGGGGGGTVGSSGGFHRNDFRRDERDRGFNRDRERDRDRDNFDEGFMNRGGDSNGRSGGFNRGDQYNRDRGDHNRGRGRIGQRN